MSTLAPRRRPAAVLALAVVALALLTGCTTADQTDDATPTPTPTQTAAADTAETGTCTDGFMLVDTDAEDAADAPVAVSSVDCELVSIVGSGGSVELGTVGTLVVEGTGVSVAVDQVTTVRLAGDDNTVTRAGEAPTTEDAGTGNAVVPAG